MFLGEKANGVTEGVHYIYIYMYMYIYIFEGQIQKSEDVTVSLGKAGGNHLPAAYLMGRCQGFCTSCAQGSVVSFIYSEQKE